MRLLIDNEIKILPIFIWTCRGIDNNGNAFTKPSRSIIALYSSFCYFLMAPWMKHDVISTKSRRRFEAEASNRSFKENIFVNNAVRCLLIK